ncbi:hypothetical protein [Streptomyces sp. URMC 129]|uniref:hypothetical protein n=1 Tax=Streptomyces sp. URMC 129 TaxID=3423407 RepID=UPI003F1C12C8
MSKAGTISVTARVPYGTRERLTALKPLLAAERRRARALAREERWDTDGLAGREAAERRAAWQRHKARLRQRGELVDTLDALVTFGVRAELAERGWNRRWPPVPAEALLPGRWPGSRDGAWPEKVPLRLPATVVGTVRGGCWHTSAEAIGQLRDWRDRYPDALPTRAFRTEHEDEALAEYERLAAQVTTVGTIWRAGIARALAAAPEFERRFAS